MMKKNIIQKVAIITILVATFALFVLSLCYVHEAWRSLTYYGTSENIPNFYKNYAYLGWVSLVFSNSNEAYQFYFTIWNDINAANNMIFNTSIVTFVLIAIAAIAGNVSRRKFYISNLVTGLLISVVGIIMSIITITKCVTVQNDFAIVQPDLDYYTTYINDKSMAINGQPGVFAIVYMVIFILLLIGFAFVTVYKFIKTYPNFKKESSIELEKEEAEKSADLDRTITTKEA